MADQQEAPLPTYDFLSNEEAAALSGLWGWTITRRVAPLVEPPPSISQKSKALRDNASTPELATGASKQRSEPRGIVEPFTPDQFLGKSMAELHGMVNDDLGILNAIARQGQQMIRTRLLVVFEEIAKRFEAGEELNGIRGTGGKGMGKYLRSLGFDPGKLRQWKFQLRKHEMLRLAQEPAPKPKPRKTNIEVVTVTETEADILAKAGVKVAKLLAGKSMMPPRERASRAEALAKEILEAVHDGQYEHLDQSDSLDHAFRHRASLADWRSHNIDRGKYEANCFAEAADSLVTSYMATYETSSFAQVLDVLDVLANHPERVKTNTQDIAQFAATLRSVADNATLLASAITTARDSATPPLTPGAQLSQKKTPSLAKIEDVACTLMLSDLSKVAQEYMTRTGKTSVPEDYSLYELKKIDRWKSLTAAMLSGLLRTVDIHPQDLGFWRGKRQVRSYDGKSIIKAAAKYSLLAA